MLEVLDSRLTGVLVGVCGWSDGGETKLYLERSFEEETEVAVEKEWWRVIAG